MISQSAKATALIPWIFLSAPAAFAAEEPARQPGPLANVLFAVLPMLILGLLLWWFLRRSQQSPLMRRSIQYYERSEQHMQRMEQIGERIATSLEKQTSERAETQGD